MTKIIEHQIFYPNTVKEVWDYLTTADLIAQWLMPNDFQPVIGHEFRFTINPIPDFNFDGIIYCKVLEIIPFTNLSYSWNFGPGDGTLNKSEVSWTLTGKDEGTDLLLVHSGPEGAGALPIFGAMDKGWLQNMKKVLTLLNPETSGAATA